MRRTVTAPSGRRPSAAGRGRRTGRLRDAVALLAAVASVVPVAACTADRPDPDAAAGELAAALARRDLTGIRIAGAAGGAAARHLSVALDGLGERRPRITVSGTPTTEAGDAATADLAWAWDLGGGTAWTYTTRAPLRLEEGGWAVEWSPAILAPGLQPGERLVTRREPAPRGDILGAGGATLVTDRPVFRAGIDKTRVPPARASRSARSLATLVDVDAAAFARRVGAAGPKAFVEAVVLRAAAVDAARRRAVAAVPGAVLVPDRRPLAPTRTFARPVLGTVGEATAELVAESRGRLRPGDLTGLSGLQRAFDAHLAGTAGIVVSAVPSGPPAADGPARVVFRREPRPGRPLATTLDLRLQARAEAVLAGVAPASALVAVRPSTGGVVAVASGPGSGGYSTATVGRYAPGSTFKVVTALALLRAGLTPDAAVACPSTLTVEGRRFGNYGDYPPARLGKIPFQDAIAHSCNTALIGAGMRLPDGALVDAARSLGLGVEAALGVPAFPGEVPGPAGRTDRAASLIGQGRITASPLAMATVAASVARGATVAPRLVTDPAVPSAASPASPGPRSLTPAEAATLRGMMRAAVTDGSARGLADVPGAPVLAKTGTAEYGAGDPPRTHAWMIAVRGDLAVAVFVADGESGSRTAGPLLERFLRGG